MTKRIFTILNQSWTATATNTGLATTTFAGVQGGASTQSVDILEFKISGMATTSTLGAFQFSCVKVTGGGFSALATPNSDGPLNVNGTSLSSAVNTYVSSASTQPITYNVATTPIIDLSLNTFGGILRWNAAPYQQFTLVGNAATAGSAVLFNCSSAGGATSVANVHIIYEPY